jgi:hypothetical protein
MDQVRIGFDLDDTLVYGDIIAEASKRLGLNFSNKDVTSLDLEGIPQTVRELTKKLFSDPEVAALNKKFLPGVQYLLKYLDHDEYAVNIVTARPKHLMPATKSMFKANGVSPHRFKFHFPNVEEDVRLAENRPSKLDVIASLKLHMYFDDAPVYCLQALQAGVQQVFLVTNKHTPWNQEPISPLVRRIKSVVDLNSWEFHNGI